MKRKKVCPMCKTYYIENHPICNPCYLKTKDIVHTLVEQKEKLEDKLDMDYSRLNSYISKFVKLVGIYKDLYYYASFLPEEIEIDPPTYEEFLNITKIDVKRFIEGKIRIYRHTIHDLGDMQFLTELKIFKDDLIDLAERYPIFEEAFDTSQIDNIISAYEK